MAITFDKSLRTIELSIDISSVTIQDLIDAIRDWEDSAEGIVSPIVANAYGKQDLGGGVKVGITLELVNDWRIHFADRTDWVTCYILAGNLVAVNSYGNNPIKPAAFVNTIIAQSTSAAIVESAGTWTENEKNMVLADVEKVKQINTGKWKLTANQMIFYEDDNVTEIERYDLYDKDGVPAMEKVYERVRVI